MPFHRLEPSRRAVLCALAAYAVVPAPGAATAPERGAASASGAAHPPDADLLVRLGGPGSPVVEIALEDYVSGAIHPEVSLGGLPRDAAMRMAEVQAILARTYAIANRHRHEAAGFDLCATTHCQVFHSSPSDHAGVEGLIAEAVERTRGLVVVHEGKVVNALFHADCGGATSAAESVWGGHTPAYLRGVDDPYCQLPRPRPWSVTLAAKEAREVLNRNPNTHVGNALHGIEVAERDTAGRAIRIQLDGERSTSVRGETFRTVLARALGPRAVRSTRLEIELVGDDYVLSGTGFGHGVGVCQIGALAQARAGHDPDDILTYYYPDTSVVSLNLVG
ncbi:MAG: SpoIID/LytB domain-containing protein [Acidobacteria bacterium]|nr:SpoIID/LytB domain-containing protein [Acidobacteriota bacterium]